MFYLYEEFNQSAVGMLGSMVNKGRSGYSKRKLLHFKVCTFGVYSRSNLFSNMDDTVSISKKN